MTSLDRASVSTLKGVGPALAEKLQRLGITTLADILFHLPLRYEDRTRVTPIGRARPGTSVVVEGDVIDCRVDYGGRRSLVAHLRDDTGLMVLRFYHFSAAQQRNLQQAGRIRCFGEVRPGKTGFEIYHPEYTKAGAGLDDALTPIYPATDGLTQARMRSLVAQVLELMDKGGLLPELLPADAGAPEPGINDAVRLVHRPPPDVDIVAMETGTHPAQRRLAFEELLAHQISMRLVREEISLLSSHPLAPPGAIVGNFIGNLGFSLTQAQQKVSEEIAHDMAQSVPMLRLLQGDVGAGKTVVAAIAALQAVENGLQAAIMAPTEILAEQHFVNFSNWLAPLGITATFLSGKVKGKKRNEQLALIESGTAAIVIGTHALFQKDVNFRALGLVIIDEQHRFGVHQRLALREKGEQAGRFPHQLVMTATPIPRTLTMSLYADMDCSIIDQLPPGRSPVITSVVADTRREQVIERVRAACGSGAQAYWVCTLIEESDVMQSQAAETTAAQLAESLPGLRIALVHGRMTPAAKTDIMNRFKQGQVDLLVATTVIEVGVDVPNASLMIIENPERLGLAQLHQLRGRIGRGERQSYCVLLYHGPLGAAGKARLNVIRESNDGFLIAEEDLRIRGPGEVYGSRQSGSVTYRIADLARDTDLIRDAGETALALLARDRGAA
ncbi:MAG: ATP-dependent DNA helicase RecG, partial [Pseudomonadales bacterium]|nr:ATP-dependent DNA helicase RecG [Pseudomonadales bacterium]